jgi:hypothetical protein
MFNDFNAKPWVTCHPEVELVKLTRNALHADVLSFGADLRIGALVKIAASFSASNLT